MVSNLIIILEEALLNPINECINTQKKKLQIEHAYPSFIVFPKFHNPKSALKFPKPTKHSLTQFQSPSVPSLSNIFSSVSTRATLRRILDPIIDSLPLRGYPLCAAAAGAHVYPDYRAARASPEIAPEMSFAGACVMFAPPPCPKNRGSSPLCLICFPRAIWPVTVAPSARFAQRLEMDFLFFF